MVTMRLVLWVLCCGLSLFLASASAKEPASITAKTALKTTQSWDGKSLPAYPSGQPEVTILNIKIMPGVALPLHQHPVINAGILTKGELLVTTQEGRTIQLTAGDAIAEVVGTWHFGRNNGDSMAEIIVFYAGIQDAPITVKK